MHTSKGSKLPLTVPRVIADGELLHAGGVEAPAWADTLVG